MLISQTAAFAAAATSVAPPDESGIHLKWVEVTVSGEMAGEAAGSYWARVVSKEGEGSYRVEDAEGVQLLVPRSPLRHRVFMNQGHAGVTGTKKHDR